jgi:hypothetical protein
MAMVVSGTSRLTGNVGVGRTATANALDVSGAIAVSGATTISGNLTVDTNTLFVNASNNRVGIGMTTPTVELDVSGDIASPALVGLVSYFAMSSAPIGWLKCNGATVSRTTYSRLFAAVGTTFGSGDGSTTFRLPVLIVFY